MFVFVAGSIVERWGRLVYRAAGMTLWNSLCELCVGLC